MNYISGPGQKQPAQFRFDLMIPQLCSPFLSHDDQIDGRQLRAMAVKKFPEQAFHPISLSRIPQALGYHQPQPGTCRGRRRQGHPEMARV
jgi:hypothetical protein